MCASITMGPVLFLYKLSYAAHMVFIPSSCGMFAYNNNNNNNNNNISSLRPLYINTLYMSSLPRYVHLDKTSFFWGSFRLQTMVGSVMTVVAGHGV